MKYGHLVVALVSTLSLASACGSSGGTTGDALTKSAPSSASATAPSSSAVASSASALATASVPDASPFGKHSLPPPAHPVDGFAPTTSGFKFQNYGNDKQYTNLTSNELRRMFGDKVCARIAGDDCTLTPAAESWMTVMNKSMGGGHCEGFAALSLLMQRGQLDPKQFGGATPFELSIDGNEKLQREIAYWFVTQNVMPMAAAENKTLTPNDVVGKIRESLKGGDATRTRSGSI